MASLPKDTGGGCYGRNSLPQSEATPQPYLPENDHVNVPTHPHYIPEVSVLWCISVPLLSRA
jgi:hypothetical protein